VQQYNRTAPAVAQWHHLPTHKPAAAQFSIARPSRSDTATTNSGCWQKKRLTKHHVGNSNDGDEMGGACGKCEGDEKYTKLFGWDSLKERGYLGKQDIKGRTILKWTLNK